MRLTFWLRYPVFVMFKPPNLIKGNSFGGLKDINCQEKVSVFF